MNDFTVNYVKYFFTREFNKNFFWNLCFEGFFYCPIDRNSFLQAQFVQNGLIMEFDDALEHVAIFHHHYFISSSLPHLTL